jgi:hypothetical protein
MVQLAEFHCTLVIWKVPIKSLHRSHNFYLKQNKLAVKMLTRLTQQVDIDPASRLYLKEYPIQTWIHIKTSIPFPCVYLKIRFLEKIASPRKMIDGKKID